MKDKEINKNVVKATEIRHVDVVVRVPRMRIIGKSKKG